jgi:glycosyltransferase involved in cell wall biosynthesis
MKKIIVRGPALSRSGYGEQTRFALRCLISSGDYDIHVLNTDWGKTSYITEDSEELRSIELLLLKTQKYHDLCKQNEQNPQYDLSLQVTIPNEWKKMAPINIGYTAGIESDKVAPVWLEKANMMDKIIVTSNHAKFGFINTSYQGTLPNGQKAVLRLEKPIKVVNYAVRDVNEVDLGLNIETETNFLCVAQWGPRKNVENTVKWFLEHFYDNQKVGLVLKLNCKDSSIIDKYETHDRIKRFLESYKDAKCKVYIIHGDMSEEELHSLYKHPKISAMISLTHGEGYGLPLFEAAYNELPIIAPDWSGHMDFLVGKDPKGRNRSLFLNVDFILQHVQKEAVWNGVLEQESRWCYPQEYSFKKRLDDFMKNSGSHIKRAKLLADQVKEKFSEKQIYPQFVEAMELTKPDLQLNAEKSDQFEEVFVV